MYLDVRTCDVFFSVLLALTGVWLLIFPLVFLCFTLYMNFTGSYRKDVPKFYINNYLLIINK